MESLILLFIYRCFIPTAVPISWFCKRKDIRFFGSTNAGAANMLEVFGPKWFCLTLFTDASKGAFAIWLGHRIGGQSFALMCGLAAVLGHCLPESLSFRGGKGIATSLGMLLVCGNPIYLVAAVVTFAISFFLSEYKISIGSVCSGLSLPLCSFLRFGLVEEVMIWGLMAMVITYRHRENIIRYHLGEEKSLFDRVKLAKV